MQIKTETKVGAFVLIALAIMAYMAIYLGAFKWHLRSYDFYTVQFANVAGLAKKADVKIAGVKVGWVDKIRLINNGQIAEVVISLSDRYKLYVDAQVEISQEGLLGSKFVSVQTGSQDQTLVLPGTCLKQQGKTPPSIDHLITKLEEVAVNINLLVNQMTPATVEIKQAIQKIDRLLQQDFDQVMTGLSETLGSASLITKKINNGDGALGKFLNEPDLYDDVRLASHKIKHISQLYNEMNLVVDSHFEAMFRDCPNYGHKQAKGYLDVWANFNKSYFGLFELVWSECGGAINRKDFFTSYYNQNNQLLSPDQISGLSCAYTVVPPLTRETVVKRDQFLYGIQAGRWFGNLAFRAGLMESYFGLALDYDIPFKNSHWNWVTTLECFDFQGQGRLCDRRPHMKWLNEVYYKDNVYLAFGIDDFISKDSLNPFIGLGLSFGDC